MMLLTKQIRNTIPKLYAQDNKGDEAIVHVKFFCPWNQWTWLVLEGEPVLDEAGNEIDFHFFGLVQGNCEIPELGYFSLNELKSVKKWSLGIERDRHFSQKTLGECKKL